jgi:hypothetical protein
MSLKVLGTVPFGNKGIPSPSILRMMAICISFSSCFSNTDWTDFGAKLAESDVLFKCVQNNEWRGQVSPEEFPFTARRLLTYGPEVKVVAPRQLQQLLMEMLEVSLNQYRGPYQERE